MKVTAAARKKIPLGQFGMPSQRKYPMPDREHAALAKSYATQQYNRGGLSLGELGRIRAKAKRVLHK